MRLLLLLLFSPLTCSVGSAEDVKVKCRNEDNAEVDWYILYKEPDGQKYTYISTKGEEKTNKGIAAKDGILAHTLKPLFDNKADFGFLSYNDQPPTGTTAGGTYGHSKGLVLGDAKTKTALWLTHSTPQFPKSKNVNGFWPSSGNKNGQTFMCLSLTLDQLKDIGTHLQNIHAYVFDKSPQFPSSFPKEIIDAANMKGQDPHFLDLKVGNTNFKLAAKGFGQKTEDGDLYVQLSRHFQSNVDAKTWCQRDNDGAFCDPHQYQVKNILDVKIGTNEWSWTKDHSKWAITTDNNRPWTCIADMNRAKSQYERLGGALCIHDDAVNKLFKGFQDDIQPCSAKKPKCDGSGPDLEALADDFEELSLNQHNDL